MYHRQFGKYAQFPMFRLMVKILSTMQTTRCKCLYLKKMYYLILRISGKYLEPRKLRTYKIYVIKTIGKYWAGVIFGHVIRIFMD